MNFFMLLLVFLSSLAVSLAQPTSPREYPVSCEGEDLKSNYGRVIYRFTFSSDCLVSLHQSHYNLGRFCDHEILVRNDGTIAHRFNFNSECRGALDDLLITRYGLYCDEGDLHQIRTNKIASLSFRSLCHEALGDASLYKGLFCENGLMKDHLGRNLRDYTFNTTCRRALPVISRTLPD